MINFEETYIKGLFIIKPDIYRDHRGYFFESYSKDKFQLNSINLEFIQDNVSHSIKKGTLRGLHFQEKPFEQSKIIYCLKGRIRDVAVDLRKDSKTYLKWFAVDLDDKNHYALLIPKGFAHGFQTLENETIVNYKVDNPYNPNKDCTIMWNDPQLNIIWPIKQPILSDKDAKAPFISNLNF